MVPFPYYDLKEIVETLFELVVKPEVIANCKSGAQLTEIDLSNKDNMLKLQSVN